jgi:hypothetical protein
MKKLLTFTALAEAATGLGLLIAPSLVGQLLLGAELAGVAVTVARVAGIALIALSVACGTGTPLVGMLVYSAAVTLYLAYVGLAGASSGILLWPAVGLHVILTALLLRAATGDAGTRTQKKVSPRRASPAARRARRRGRRSRLPTGGSPRPPGSP